MLPCPSCDGPAIDYQRRGFFNEFNAYVVRCESLIKPTCELKSVESKSLKTAIEIWNGWDRNQCPACSYLDLNKGTKYKECPECAAKEQSK